MKKLLLNFADGLLSREQMKVVRGGEYGEGAGGGSGNCPIGECRPYQDGSGCGYWRLDFCYEGGLQSWSKHQTASWPCGYA